MTEHETGGRRGLPGEGTGMTPPPPGFEQPQQVDRMTVIARNECPEHGYRPDRTRVGEHGAQLCAICGARTAEVEYVRADQLTGAVEAFAQERQAVLDCVNLYGDETLHKALDAIGWPGDYIGGQ